MFKATIPLDLLFPTEGGASKSATLFLGGTRLEGNSAPDGGAVAVHAAHTVMFGDTTVLAGALCLLYCTVRA